MTTIYHTPDVREPVLVTAREHLDEVAAEMALSSRLAIDTESNGFYAYQEKVCLLQMSTEGTDYIIDPIAIKDLSALAPMMEDPAVEKIFHAGEYDVLCLKRDYGFRFANLFDTMIASRILAFKELGLAAAIERHFGLKLSKKLQRADWGKRPLTREQIRYAQLDTHFLMRLTDIQKGLLKEKRRFEDAQEAFEELCRLEPVTRVFDPEGYWKMVGRHQLTPQQVSCLKEVFLFREKQAQSRNRAPFRVMPEDLMVRVAASMPSTREELGALRGMTPYLLDRYGATLLDAVERGKAAEPPALPKRERERRDHREWKLFEELRAWRKAQAASEGVEPVVILSSETLHDIARRAFAAGDPLHAVSQLKRGRYGEAIEKLVRQAQAP